MNADLVRSLVASDGYRLHFRHWPAAKPRGLVIAVHGIQSHSNWYRRSSAALAADGYEVYFADRRGSGMNSEKRGHADHGQRLIHDVRQLIQLAQREHPVSSGDSSRSLPLTIMGISWGGKIAAATAAVVPEDVDRLMLLYPGLLPRIGPNRWQRLQLRLAEILDIRHRRVSIPLHDPELFTSSTEWQEYIRSDPLALHDVTTGFLNAGIDLDQIICTRAASIIQPTLLMLAGRDRIVHNARTTRLVTGFSCRRLTIIQYPDASHTLEFEHQARTFVDDLLNWLREELKR